MRVAKMPVARREARVHAVHMGPAADDFAWSNQGTAPCRRAIPLDAMGR